ncbi:MAG: hypothetical protein FD161_704 [Limisphaerales bacterium]|nr:MAG: hypothetical protein FD161_704 [Limisphaerales bacterium]KAG0510062.1 MAG: hypothetical protein E1N63_704 [Limisphaerales bacterium]TXT52905.1 MAG: hypothetical protein FD140_13 [Limisphaerales bacterium]
MTELHSPAFEARAAARVRGTCRKRPADWRMHQQGRRTARGTMLRQLGGFMLAAFFPLLPLLVMWRRLESSGARLALALYALWAGAAFTNLLRARLFSSPDALALRNLPIADADTFAFQWRQTVLGQALTVLPGLAAGMAMLAAMEGHTGWKMVGAAAAGVVAWGVGLATGLWVVLLGWSRGLFWFSIGTVGLLLLGFIPWTAKLARSALDAVEPLLSLLLPTAWPGRLLADTLQHGPGLALLLAVPAVALLVSISMARRRVAASYAPEEPMFSVPMDDFDHDECEAATTGLPVQPDVVAPTAKAGPTELEDFIRSRAWLAVEAWPPRGWIERQVERWLTARERTLAEVMMPGPPDWSRNWVWGAKGLVFSICVGLGLEVLKVEWFWLAYLIGGGAAALAVLPIGSGLGRACGPYWAGGATFTFHAGFPLAYREFTRLAWKIATVRAVAALPLALAFATFLFLKYGGPHDPWWAGPLQGVRVVWFFWALRPLLAATRWSTGTNDTHRMSLWALVVLAGALPAYVVFGVAGLIAVFAPHWSAVPAGLLAMGASFGFQWFYGRLVARNRFDYTPSKSQSEAWDGGWKV